MQFFQHMNTHDNGRQRRLDTRRRRGSKLIGSKASRGDTRRGSLINRSSGRLVVEIASYNRRGAYRDEVASEIEQGITFAEAAEEKEMAVERGDGYYPYGTLALSRKRPRRLMSLLLVALPPRKPALKAEPSAPLPMPSLALQPLIAIASHGSSPHIRTSCGWMGDLGRAQKRPR